MPTAVTSVFAPMGTPLYLSGWVFSQQVNERKLELGLSFESERFARAAVTSPVSFLPCV